MLTKEASLDISPKWIILELTISAEKDASLRPAFKVKGELEPEWLRMSLDRTWLVMVLKSDQMLMLMGVDMEAEDYQTAIGEDNGKF